MRNRSSSKNCIVTAYFHTHTKKSEEKAEDCKAGHLKEVVVVGGGQDIRWSDTSESIFFY